jgi:hypothetical protein
MSPGGCCCPTAVIAAVLSLGDQLAVPGSTVVHERCYEAFDPEGRAEAEP